MTALAVAALGLIGTLAGVLVGRRQRAAGAELSEVQADEITERIYGRIVERLETEVARLTGQVDILERRVAELAKALENRTAELLVVRVERDAAVAEVATLRAQLAERTAALGELRLELTKCRACPAGPIGQEIR